MASFPSSHRLSPILILASLCSCNKSGKPKQDFILIPKISENKINVKDKFLFDNPDKLALKIPIDLLRNRTKDNLDFEIRIWHGFGLAKLECIIISKHFSQWSALKISDNQDKPHIINQNDGHFIKNTWNSTLNNNLRFLKEIIEPSDPSAPPGPPIATSFICDETGYLLEVSENGKYCATYGRYHSNDGQQLKQIFETLDKLFNVQTPRSHA